MEIINKNLRFLRKKKGLSQVELAAKLSIDRKKIGSYDEFRAVPPLKLCVRIAKVFDVSLDSLLKDDLETTLIQEPASALTSVLAITVDSDNRENIELVSQKASAGYTNGFSDVEFLKSLPKIYVPNLPTLTHRCFEITGDSMLPVKNKDLMLCSFVEGPGKIKSGKTYVILSRTEGIVYKRVYPYVAEGKLLLFSDNTAYEPYLVDLKEVMEIWAFAARISFQEDPRIPLPADVMDPLINLLFSKLNH